MVADLLFLEVFIEEDPHHHCEGPAAEEEGVLGLQDTRFDCEIRYERAKSCKMATVGDQGNRIEDEVADVLMVFDFI